jgi:hypothetical protein
MTGDRIKERKSPQISQINTDKPQEKNLRHLRNLWTLNYEFFWRR